MPRCCRSLILMQMKDRTSLIVASIFGLVAGIGHGVVSHIQQLPFSLSEQAIESLKQDNFD